MKRHDLVFFKGSYKRDKILTIEEVSSLGHEIDKIPGIIKRQETKNSNFLELGLSFPIKRDKVRVRGVIKINKNNISKVVSPYEVIEHYLISEKRNPIIDKIINLSEDLHIKLGIYGSLALNIMTGLPYFGEDSDIDLLINISKYSKLEDFYKELIFLEETFNIKLDVEIQIKNNFYVKLKEYFDDNVTILKKGLYSLELECKKNLNL